MKTLYIIGNGFDRHHKLPTEYKDFNKYVINNSTSLRDDFEEYFSLRKDKKDNLWSDFEKDLGTFDYEYFFDKINNIDVCEENFKPSLVYCLEDELNQITEELIEQIRNTFESWIEEINLDSLEKNLPLEKDALFLNFNYTLTLEKVYQIHLDKIFHIHGDIERRKSDIIFGHNKAIEKDPELDENGDSNRTPFSDSENIAKYPFNAFRKPVYNIIQENQLYFEKLKSVKRIFVLGHGLDVIDIPYFKEILKHTKNVFWNVSFYNQNEKEKHLTTLQNIGINKNSIKMFQLEELQNLNL